MSLVITSYYVIKKTVFKLELRALESFRKFLTRNLLDNTLACRWMMRGFR